MSDAAPSPVTDSREAARAAGLRFCTDSSPGFSRRRSGRGFSYRDRDGATIRDPEVIRRIRALAIPPAWTDVWICPWPNGHVQATGRDARGRKQHRYHPDWRSHRDETKFGRLIEFAKALPAIRARVDEDLARPGLPREKVLATVVRLLELTLIRVGNDEYSRLNRSFGLTTLRDRHVKVRGSAVRFRFRGKGGKQHEVGLRDRRLAALVRRCQELPGQELFQYREDGEVGDVTSDDVNAYIREVSGGDFTAKDFRTWAGTVLAYRALRALEAADGEPAARRNVVQAIRQTASLLGNTAAVCRASYVHPAVLDAYVEGRIAAAAVAADSTDDDAGGDAAAGLGPDEEGAVLRLLRKRLETDAGRGRATGPRRRTSRPQRGR
jgi:DNA topoisomerase-1